MANWLLTQQAVLSVMILLLICLERWAIKPLGANNLYKLWLLLPVSLMVNNLPSDISPFNGSQLQQYVVQLSLQPERFELDLSWQFIWALGALSILLLAAYSHWKILNLPASRDDSAASVIALPANLAVMTSAHIAGPVIAGLWSPRLLLPAHFKRDFSSQQQRLILEHELLHFKRKDNLFNLLALLLVALCWFNPLVWLAYKVFRRSQELACDATVLAQKTLCEKIIYSKTLLQCAEHSLYRLAIHSPYSEKTTMYKRLDLIKTNTRAKPLYLGLALLVSAGLLSGIALANQPPVVNQDQVNLATPIYRVEPVYPLKAAQNNISGSVVLQFDISTDGSTENVKVITAQPQLTFDQVSVAALEQWKYKPKIMGGKALKQEDLLVQLDFQLATSAVPSRSLVEKTKVSK
jgi:bla regulator protein BlaR1